MPGESAYVDTSVLAAYYCPEPQSAKAEEALRRIVVPVVSNLSEVEFCSVIARKRRLRELNERQAKAILDLFAGHVAEGYYRRVPLNGEHFARARMLITAMGSPLRTLDALHLATAIAESLKLMTADRELAKAAKRQKCGVILV